MEYAAGKKLNQERLLKARRLLILATDSGYLTSKQSPLDTIARASSQGCTRAAVELLNLAIKTEEHYG